MRRFVVAMLGLAAVSFLGVRAGDAAITRDSFVCGQITPGAIEFLTQFYDGGGGTVLLLGFLRLHGVPEIVPFSGSAVLLGDASALKFTATAAGASVGAFTLAGRFSLTGQSHTGACFGPSPCEPEGQEVTFTLSLACPTR